MKKRSVITLSIILFLIVLISVLFGAVFCLRSQSVTVVGTEGITQSNNEIIQAGKLKKGQSIFMLDKTSAINKIEATYADLKVVQIKTTSLFKVNIRVRARKVMAYSEFNEKYYLLDEELKVLQILDKSQDGELSNEPTNYTCIQSDLLNINSKTKICDFVGNSFQTKAFYNLYNAMINTFQKDGESGKEYFTRTDVQEMVRTLEFIQEKTFNKIIITTKYGVKLDIENPTNNLTNKINICYATIESFISNANNKEKSGTIKIYFDLDNNQKCIYIPDAE